MLKQPLSSQEAPASEMRVKKEEFARAIAALEARRQAEAQQQEGTVVIGDVLQQLQINVPAEEVLQEIEALHAGQPKEQTIRRPHWNAEQAATAKLCTAITCVPLIAIFIAALFSPFRLSAPTSSINFGSLPQGSQMLWTPPPPNLPGGVTPDVMDEGGFNASSVLMPLSQVPDNQPVHCNTQSLTQLCNSYTRSQMDHLQSGPPVRPFGTLDPAALSRSSQRFDVRPNLHKPWTLIKHGGKLYLRGWVTAKFTAAESKNGIVTLHSTPQSFDAGVHPVPATLLMSFLQYSGDQMDYPLGIGESGSPPLVKARNVEVDAHTWEKW